MKAFNTELGELWHGDCLKLMNNISDKSVDMILCDLPFGTTYQKWDKIINFDDLWRQYRRVVKDNGAIVLNSSQPFTTLLAFSAIDIFRYTWIWDKTNPTNFPNAKKQPLKSHEEICVFYKQQCKYFPQMTQGKPNHKQGNSTTNISEIRLIKDRVSDDLSGMKYPKSILNFPKHSSHCKFHPNQKPIELCEYLIKTYTDEGDLVLDNSSGSGTVGLASENLGRKWICIEKEEKYIQATKTRFFYKRNPELNVKIKSRFKLGQKVKYQGEIHEIHDIDEGYGYLALSGDRYITPNHKDNRCISALMSECEKL